MDELKIGNSIFRVGLVSLSRSFRVDEKYRVTTEDGKIRREIRGIYTDYAVEIGDVDQEQYDLLIETLTSTEESQTVTLPYGRVGTITFQAAFESISDGISYIDEDDEGNDEYFWDNLTVTFTAFEPKGVGA
jgi:hypothetical protein